MDQPKARNEFGLDKANALDVQKEHAKSMLPWIAGAVGLVVAFALMMFVLPSIRTNDGTHVPAAPPASTPAAR